MCFEWHKRFKEVKKDSRSKRLSIKKTQINNELIRQVKCGNHQLTVWMFASYSDMKKRTVFRRLSPKIWAYGKSAKMVLVCWMMFRRSTSKCVRTSSNIFTLSQTCFLAITGDNTWIFVEDLENKCYSSQWKSLASPKKAKQSKVMLITFFNVRDIVHR